MHRKPTFEPTNVDVYEVQKRQFDWSLLQSGNICHYSNRFELDSACRRLQELTYRVHRFDASSWTTINDCLEGMAESLEYSPSYGGSVDALPDVFFDLGTFLIGNARDARGTVLAFSNFDSLIDIDRDLTNYIIQAFARWSRFAALCAHPMIWINGAS